MTLLIYPQTYKNPFPSQETTDRIFKTISWRFVQSTTKYQISTIFRSTFGGILATQNIHHRTDSLTQHSHEPIHRTTSRHILFITRNHRQNLQNDQLKIRTKHHKVSNLNHLTKHFRRYSRKTKHPPLYRFPDSTFKLRPWGVSKGGVKEKMEYIILYISFSASKALPFAAGAF